MPTTTEMLLPQLVEIWLPNHNATQGSSIKLSEVIPPSQIPPFVKFLNRLPTTGERDERKKRLPCGHSVSLSSMLEVCNFLGGNISQTGPNFMGCPEQQCRKWISCPAILEPWALDGLEMRLTLIQWSWNKDAPTEGDRVSVSLLRDMLSKIGYLTQEPEPVPETELEPEVEGQPSSSAASESSLMQTLVDVEIEACNLKELNTAARAESPFDSGEPYCSFRPVIPCDPSTPYPMQSLGQHCYCVVPHQFVREPSDWGLGLTPAEMVSDSEEPKKEKRKTVRFVAPVVTEVQYFDKWFNDEYRDSGRYWSTGPHRKSTDRATQAEDDLEIERLEFPERFRGRRASVEDGPEGANWFSDYEDEDESDGLVAELEREMERAGEALDDEKIGGDKKDENDKMDEDQKELDEAQKGRELWNELWNESMEDLKKHYESWEDMF